MNLLPKNTQKNYNRIKVAIASYIPCFACRFDFPGDSKLEDFLHSYGADLTMPMGFYLMARAYNISPTIASIIIGGAGIISEFADKVKPNQTFDPNDFLAYGISIGAAYTIDQLIERR